MAANTFLLTFLGTIFRFVCLMFLIYAWFICKGTLRKIVQYAILVWSLVILYGIVHALAHLYYMPFSYAVIVEFIVSFLIMVFFIGVTITLKKVCITSVSPKKAKR